jgi:hypothetical protein
MLASSQSLLSQVIRYKGINPKQRYKINVTGNMGGAQGEISCSAQEARMLIEAIFDVHTGPGAVGWDLLGGSGVCTLSAALRGYRGVYLDHNPDMHKLVRHRLAHAQTTVEEIVAQVKKRRKDRAKFKEKLAAANADHSLPSPVKKRVKQAGVITGKYKRHQKYKAWKKAHRSTRGEARMRHLEMRAPPRSGPRRRIAKKRVAKKAEEERPLADDEAMEAGEDEKVESGEGEKEEDEEAAAAEGEESKGEPKATSGDEKGKRSSAAGSNSEWEYSDDKVRLCVSFPPLSVTCWPPGPLVPGI